MIQSIRIDEDPVWHQVGSNEFHQKYIIHDIAAIASISHEKLTVHSLKTNLQSLIEQMDQVNETEAHNNLFIAW
jgi:hypothetical protein